jgi:putative MATE family efflux protein
MLGSQVIQLAAGSAATAVLGRLNGAHALAAAVAPIALSGLCGALFSGFTTGAMILLSRARGADDKAAANRIVAESLGLALILGVLFAAAILGLDARIMHAMNVAPSLMPAAVAYTQVVAIALPVSFLYTMYAALLEGAGDSKTPLYMLIAVTALFLPLLTLLVPHFGATGVPLASLFSAFAVTLAVAAFVHVRPRFALPRRAMLHAMLKLDLPIGVQYVAVMLSDMALISIVNDYGPHASAAYGVVNQIVTFVMAPISIFATAVSVFAGQALGAGSVPQALRALRTCLILDLALTVAITVLSYVFAAPLTRAFTADPQVLALARDALFAMLWSVPVLGIGGVVCGLLDATGDAFWPMATTVAGVWLVLVPCAHAFSAHDGAIGVWRAYPVAYAIIAFVQVGCALILQKKRRLSVEAPSIS